MSIYMYMHSPIFSFTFSSNYSTCIDVNITLLFISTQKNILVSLQMQNFFSSRKKSEIWSVVFDLFAYIALNQQVVRVSEVVA